MQINLDPNQSGLGRVPLAAVLPPAQRCGFDAVTFPLREIGSVRQAQAAAALVSDHGLQWSIMPMDLDMLRECSGAEFAADLERLRRQMDLAQEAGVPRYYNHVWPGSNERARDANFAWCVDRFGQVFEAARAHGLQAGLEFLGPKPLRDSFRYPFIWTLPDILALADAISPQVGVQFDTYHWYTSGATVEQIKLLGRGDRVVGVHLNDGWKGRSREQQEDLERELPLATGVIDSVAAIRALHELGYAGPVWVEPFEPAATRLQAMPLEQALGVVYASTREVLRRAGALQGAAAEP